MGKNETYPVLMVPGMVLYPTLSVPIQIENSNLLDLINKVIEKNDAIIVAMAEPVGMEFSNDNGIAQIKYAPRRVGTLAYPRKLEKLGIDQNGNVVYKLIVQGIKKVRLTGQMIVSGDTCSYKTIDMPDILESGVLGDTTIQRLIEKFKIWMSQNVLDHEERDHFLSTLKDVDSIINAMTFLMVQDRETRQFLLECNSLLERILILNGLFLESVNKENEQMNEALKIFEVIETLAASGN